MKDGCLIFFLTIIMIATVVLILSTDQGARFFSNDSKSDKNTSHRDSLIDTLIKQNHASVNCDSCHVYIDSIIWSNSDASARQNMAIAFASYVQRKNHDPNNFQGIEIFEKNSRRKLAYWKLGSGFKQFEP
jgi:hypothetical protein